MPSRVREMNYDGLFSRTLSKWIRGRSSSLFSAHCSNMRYEGGTLVQALERPMAPPMAMPLFFSPRFCFQRDTQTPCCTHYNNTGSVAKESTGLLVCLHPLKHSEIYETQEPPELLNRLRSYSERWKLASLVPKSFTEGSEEEEHTHTHRWHHIWETFPQSFLKCLSFFIKLDVQLL